jgi:hypothetical protein
MNAFPQLYDHLRVRESNVGTGALKNRMVLNKKRMHVTNRPVYIDLAYIEPY